jgi:predicted alpha/beta hydrolase family esterase
MAQLEEAVLSQRQPCVLVAHSLGCLLVASWAAHSRNTAKVLAALLVAPGDAERENLRPLLASWAPVTMQALPFPSVLLASQNDPFCSFARAKAMAAAWGARCIDYGMAGHINADAGLGDWPDGHAHLTHMMDTKEYSHGD